MGSSSLQKGLRGDFATTSKHPDGTDSPSYILHMYTHLCIFPCCFFLRQEINYQANSSQLCQPTPLAALTKDDQGQFMPEVCQSVHKERCYDPTEVTQGGADEDSQVPAVQIHTHT